MIIFAVTVAPPVVLGEWLNMKMLHFNPAILSLTNNPKLFIFDLMIINVNV